MQLVDEQDHLALLGRQILEHRFQPFLEFAAVLGAGDQRCQIQTQQPLVLQAFGYFTVDDALRQALGDGGLAHARFADQRRVVLAPAREHLHHAPDFLVAADHRVQLALLGALGEIHGVAAQRLALILGASRIDIGATAQLGDGLFQPLGVGAGLAQCLAEGGFVLHQRQQPELAGDELVLALLGQFVGEVQQPCQFVADGYLAGGLLQRGDGRQLLLQGRLYRVQFGTGLLQQGRGHAIGLLQQRVQQVGWLDL